MSQLENTQSIVLQQADGKKIYLDLNVSTDTTAIWSFWLAMIIALILGASATLIAVWYGRKSFKLTEMSFRTVSEDIKEAAHLNKAVNENMLEAQYRLKSLEQKNDFIRYWTANFIEEVISLDQEATENFNILKIYLFRDINSLDSDLIKEVRLSNGSLYKRISRIKLLLRTNLVLSDQLNSDLESFKKILAKATNNWISGQNMSQEQWLLLVKQHQLINEDLIEIISREIEKIKAA